MHGQGSVLEIETQGEYLKNFLQYSFQRLSSYHADEATVHRGLLGFLRLLRHLHAEGQPERGYSSHDSQQVSK